MKTTGFDYNNLDRQIADMLKCKPLPELEVKALCEKVVAFLLRQKKFLENSRMLSLSEHPWSFVEIYMASSMI